MLFDLTKKIGSSVLKRKGKHGLGGFELADVLTEKPNWNLRKVIAQYESIRRLGQTNMLDKNMVQRIAYENGFYELVVAIEEDYHYILKNYSDLMKLIDEKDIPKAKSIRAKWELVK